MASDRQPARPASADQFTMDVRVRHRSVTVYGEDNTAVLDYEDQCRQFTPRAAKVAERQTYCLMLYPARRVLRAELRDERGHVVQEWRMDFPQDSRWHTFKAWPKPSQWPWTCSIRIVR